MKVPTFKGQPLFWVMNEDASVRPATPEEVNSSPVDQVLQDTYIDGQYQVTTTFLGILQVDGEGLEPTLFEVEVQDSLAKNSISIARFKTLQEAYEVHDQYVNELKKDI